MHDTTQKKDIQNISDDMNQKGISIHMNKNMNNRNITIINTHTKLENQIPPSTESSPVN